MKNKQKLTIGILVIAVSLYIGFLIKKSYIDKGWSDEDQMKEDLISKYVIMLGLPDTEENRKKYRKMTLEQLRKELSFDILILE